MRRTVFLGLATVIPLTSYGQTERKLNVQQAIEEAMQQSPRIQAAKDRLTAAGASADSLRGRLLPGVHLSGEAQHYDKPFAIQFPSQGGGSSPSIVARNINTTTFSAGAAQPVLGLLHLSQDFGALNDAATAAEKNLAVTQASVREEVETTYLRLFEARALIQIAQASEKQLSEQLQVMQARLAAGAATKADVLRVKVAVANARQQEIQATAQEQIERANLLVAIGRLPDDLTIVFEEPVGVQASPSTEDNLHLDIETALVRRPEAQAAQLNTRSAMQRARARAFELLPELNLEAAYLRITGQIFMPPESFFVGIKADWPIFEWGAKWYERKAAAAQAEATARDAEETRRRIGAEVSARRAQLNAALYAVDVANTAIASAEEAYRVTEALVKTGAGTTTDLLDSQAALTQARLNLTRARYEWEISKVAFRRAIGSL